MPNAGYIYSRAKETQVKHDFEKEGWYAVRAAGSKGIADVIAIRPTKCGHASHFEVRFIQIKTDVDLKKFRIVYKQEKTPFGEVNVEYFKFPHKRKVVK